MKKLYKLNEVNEVEGIVKQALTLYIVLYDDKFCTQKMYGNVLSDTRSPNIEDDELKKFYTVKCKD